MANDYLGQAGLTALIAKIKTAISTAVSGLYTKPSTGVPKSDLASDVQTSLGKADTALQSFTETDPVFSASAASGITSTDITNWNNKTSSTGTVTSVAVKMNNAVKGTITTSGTIDLGSVLTEKPTYTASEVGAATSTDITNAINALDVSSVGGDGKYIKLISETNGKISATAADMPTSLPPTSHTHSRDDINYPSVKTLSWSKANDLQIYYMNSKKVMSFYFGGSTASYNQGFTIDVMHGGTTASIMITWQNNAGASGSLYVGYSVIGNDAGNSKWNVSYFKVADSGDIFIFVYTDVALTDSDANAYTLKFTGITDKSIYVNAVDPTNADFKNSTSASLQAIGISRGGTNATTAKEILYNIRNGITNWTTPDDDEVIFAVNSNNTNAGHYTFKEVWDNYLDGKVSSSYAKKLSSGSGNLAAIGTNGEYVSSGMTASSVSSAVRAVSGKQDALPTTGGASDTYAINISGCSEMINSHVTSDDHVYYVGFLNTEGGNASGCWMRTGGTGNLNGTTKLTYNPSSNLLCANLNGSAYFLAAMRADGSSFYTENWKIRLKWSGDYLFVETLTNSTWTHSMSKIIPIVGGLNDETSSQGTKILAGWDSADIGTITPSASSSSTKTTTKYIAGMYGTGGGTVHIAPCNASNVTTGNSIKWNNYKLSVTTSIGTSTDTIYFVK